MSTRKPNFQESLEILVSGEGSEAQTWDAVKYVASCSSVPTWWLQEAELDGTETPEDLWYAFTAEEDDYEGEEDSDFGEV
jgi:hypothetical protein